MRVIVAKDLRAVWCQWWLFFKHSYYFVRVNELRGSCFASKRQQNSQLLKVLAA